MNHILKNDRIILRDLAREVREVIVANEGYYSPLIKLWKEHNSLKKTRPLILVFPGDEYWEDFFEKQLETTTEFSRRWERELKILIYRSKYLRDDNPIEPIIKVPVVYENTGWGLPISHIKSSMKRGAWKYDPSLKDPADLKKMTFPKIIIHEEETKRNYETLTETIGDILTVKTSYGICVPGCSLLDTFAHLRGLDQLMLDLYDRPRWVHEVLEFLTVGTSEVLDSLEKLGYLELNNGNERIGTGGLGYTDELPSKDFNSRKVKLSDLCGWAQTQEFVRVSPKMHEEFALPYQIRLLKKFGLNAYGCCEPLTDRLENVTKIPRLRRINISPWADLEVAVNILQDKYVLAWKPNPTMVAGVTFNADYVRTELKKGIEIAKDSIMHIVLCGVPHVENEQWRVSRWLEIAYELVENRGY